MQKYKIIDSLQKNFYLFFIPFYFIIISKGNDNYMSFPFLLITVG